jgi:hypothetical protein
MSRQNCLDGENQDARASRGASERWGVLLPHTPLRTFLHLYLVERLLAAIFDLSDGKLHDQQMIFNEDEVIHREFPLLPEESRQLETTVAVPGHDFVSHRHGNHPSRNGLYYNTTARTSVYQQSLTLL